VVRKILAVTGKSSSLIQKVENRPGPDRRYTLSSEKLTRETGWVPQVRFEDGLLQTVEWYRNNPGVDRAYQVGRVSDLLRAITITREITKTGCMNGPLPCRSRAPHEPLALCYDKPVKGVVLAGGTGSRLFPLTKITNKHLLPVYDKPMVYYPIQTMVDAGIRDILMVTGGKNAGEFLRLLANEKHFGLTHIDYTYQEGEGGIADALTLAEHFADGQKLCVILGYNIIEESIRDAVDAFQKGY